MLSCSHINASSIACMECVGLVRLHSYVHKVLRANDGSVIHSHNHIIVFQPAKLSRKVFVHLDAHPCRHFHAANGRRDDKAEQEEEDDAGYYISISPCCKDAVLDMVWLLPELFFVDINKRP